MDESTAMGNRHQRRSFLSGGNGRHRTSGDSRSRKSGGNDYSGIHRRSSRGEFHNRSDVGANTLPDWYHIGAISLAILAITTCMILLLLGM